MPANESPNDPPASANPEPFQGFEVATSERVYDSHWCGLRRDHLKLEGGKLQEYHVFEVPDACAVVPVLESGNLLMIWQYRYPHGKTHWEVPAGRIDEGEDVAVAVRRELREETGHEAREVERLGGFYPTNGISAHYAHLYVARGCVRVGELELDAAEVLEVREFSPEQVRGLLRSGAIADGFTALALFYYFDSLSS